METSTKSIPTKIDNIKNLYAQLNHKTNFTIALANELDKSPQSLRVHWFGNFWSIPDEYQDTVISFLQNTIKNQN